VAIGNATAEVKAVAAAIAPPQAQDGAAWAIEQFVLKETE
jgi:hydroxymethylpyrimidine pyrophosphatase-like HAD family hydrolase